MGVSFLVASLVLLSISIYSVYSFLSFLLSANLLSKIIILSSLVVICVGFISAMILSRTSDSQLINSSYVIFSLALGFLFYLTIISILFQLVRLFNFQLDYVALARIGLFLAIVLFTIGLFQASFPKIKPLMVKLNGLSENWRGKHVVQISDVHLGSIYGLNFLTKQIDKINSLNPDLIVITGDLFDGSKQQLDIFGPALAKLHAKHGVIFVPGNHDTYLGLDKIEPVLRQANITVLRDEAITIDGLEIIGLDLHKLTGTDDNLVIKNLSPYTGQARLLLKHVPKDIAWAKETNIGLQLSGHSHNGQMFPLQILTYLFYGKYQFGWHSDGIYHIYTSSGLGSWGPPVRTFNQAEIIDITLN